MNISKIFIDRPIATSLMMLAIALFGMIAYRALPVSDLPNVDFPTLLVTASLPGASPETMAAAVATPLENQFSMIAGLSSMSSANSLGNTQITLEFDLNRKLDGAAVDVQAAITQASRLLPQGMPTPPTFTKVNPADQPILYIALTSPSLPLYTLDDYAETRIAQRISMISGVAQVQVLGAQKYAVHVQMDPHALASRQIGINEVESALKNWNVNLPTGAIVGPQRSFTLQASGQLMKAEQYRPVVVAYRKGSPVMLEDIVRHIEMGERPLMAALRGSGEIGFTIVSMTLSLAAVFIPVLFMGGVLGRLFKEFAVTICVAILISGVVSVTLTPMLCSRFLRSMHEGRHGWFYRITERYFDLL